MGLAYRISSEYFIGEDALKEDRVRQASTTTVAFFAWAAKTMLISFPPEGVPEAPAEEHYDKMIEHVSDSEDESLRVEAIAQEETANSTMLERAPCLHVRDATADCEVGSVPPLRVVIHGARNIPGVKR